MPSVQALYAARIAREGFSPDAVQQNAALRLDALARLLRKRRGLFGGGRVRGLYLWGPVGRGKSMLMDLFAQSASHGDLRRVHFHAFMLEQHAQLRAERARGQAQDEVIVRIAHSLAKHTRVLCLDELQISDITDALIVGRLFEHLLARGVTILATSNRPPRDLYRHGLNRQLFEPFIDLIEKNLDVLELAAARDYRLERLSQAPVWHAPLGEEADRAIDDAWSRLTCGARPLPSALEVQGRRWEIARTAAGCARLSFDEACRTARGAADYLELAEHFHTILLENIPALQPQDREAAARFRTLIDALYEAKTKLVASAASEPALLYRQGDQSFEFERTVSRLMEMRARDYLAAPRRDAAFHNALVDT